VLDRQRVVAPASLSTIFSDDQEECRKDITLGDTLATTEQPATAERLDRLDRWTRGLDLASRMVLAHYYLNGITLRKVGELLGLSESRCSQILDKAKAFLRENRRPEEF